MPLQIIKSDDFEIDFRNMLKAIDYDKLFILTDQETLEHCFPLLQKTQLVDTEDVIQIKSGDTFKNINSLFYIWDYLCENEATRKSLLINLGGGMITDLGGFAAAVFKRGIRFINIPTTLLSMVDAAVGGKTGINFHGLKNEIGTFTFPEAVLINTEFLKTLDTKNFLSGYAEMLKHGLISSDKDYLEILNFDLDRIDYTKLSRLLVSSIEIKSRIVEKDPTESEIRKVLNFGHTIGHAIESYLMEIDKPVLHGYAVAWGMVCELYLSFRVFTFNKHKLIEISQFIKDNYGSFCFTCKQYDLLYELMLHDKKNTSYGNINFTLLKDVGDARINQMVSKNEVLEAFDFYREFFGC